MKVYTQQWYNCLINRPELCKVTQAAITDPATGVVVHAWRVVCYYTGEDVYVGSLKECKQWIDEHSIGGIENVKK